MKITIHERAKGELHFRIFLSQVDWDGLNSLLIATKLMLVNDLTANEMEPQGAIAVTLLTSLCGQQLASRIRLTTNVMQ